MKKLFVICILFIGLAGYGQVETVTLDDLPAKDTLKRTDKIFLEDTDDYTYHAQLGDLFDWVEDSVTASVPMTATSTNYTSASGSEAVAFIDLSIWNDTLFVGDAAARANDRIYVARTDFTNSVVISGTGNFYYRSTGYATFMLSKNMAGCVMQSDGTNWYIFGIWYDYYHTPTRYSVTDSTTVGGYTAKEKLTVSGAISIGASGTPQAGSIQWDGSNFEGYDGSQWIRLDSAYGNYVSVKEDAYGAKGDSVTNDLTAFTDALVANDNIFIPKGNYLLSGTLTIPAGKQLIFARGAILRGTGTVTGNETDIQAGNWQIFDTTVSFSGTWVVNDVYVDWFGMVGDGTDESERWKDCLAFAALTENKKIELQQRDYVVQDNSFTWSSGGEINGNGCTFYHNYSSGNAYFLKIEGSVGTYDTLPANAVMGAYYMVADLGSPLLDADTGDLIKIISDDSVHPSYPLNLIGEIKKVNKVSNDTIFFTEYIYETYKVSSYARAAIVSNKTAVVKNLNIVQPNIDNSFGIWVYYGDPVKIEGVNFHNVKYASMNIVNCYNPVIKDIQVDNSSMVGVGYGVTITGATMNALVDNLVGRSTRHATAFGTSQLGGRPWNSRVVNCVGVGYYTGVHIFDAHPGVPGIIYENCKAIGGIPLEVTGFRGLYSADSTYAVNDIVELNGVFYKSETAGNINNDPEILTHQHWRNYNSFVRGFTVMGDGSSILNCETVNCGLGLYIGTSISNLLVDGFKCTNVVLPMYLKTGTFTNCTFKNIQGYNYNSTLTYERPWMLSAYECGFVNTVFDNIVGHNIGGIVTTRLTGGTLKVGSLSCYNVALRVSAQTDSLKIIINNMYITDVDDPYYDECIVVNSGVVGLTDLIIDNLDITDLTDIAIYINSDLDNLRLGNVRTDDVNGAVKFIVTNSALTLGRIEIGSIIHSGTNAFSPLVDNQSTLPEGYVGSASGNITALWTTQPTIESYAGTTNNGLIERKTTNLGFGVNLLDSLSTGTNNLLVGISAGSPITTGGYNTVLGNSAGLLMTIGAQNTFIGYQAAGNGIVTGSYNQMIGYRPGFSLTAGQYNVGIGHTSLYQLSTGSYNVGIGRNTLYAISTTSNSTAVGANSNIFNSGASNTSIGFESLKGVEGSSTGEGNVAVGYEAAELLTTGANNVFVGHQSGAAGTVTGSNNTALGVKTLYAVTSGQKNTMVGGLSGTANTTGANNTYLGFQAGGTNISGARNVFLGYQAGYSELGTDKLYIESSSSATPLIFGDFAADSVTINGSLGVTGSYKLDGYNLINNTGTPLLLISSAVPYMNVNGNFSCGSLGRSPAAELEVNGTTITTVLQLTPGSAPGSPSEGTIYMDSSTHKLMVYDGTSWQACW